ncbi:efflux RND transporter periplasmic adaptor subunit [Dethiosulfovibrio sp. F2B]|uniref:efflux RND transporter periplasmic adaptor subunit n=1 Tax=Dethiosulfovibrio faecalis TaxID=2720018 RepID=UPI001F472084|nr:efflux RND transporter periplasmic adaptor subunit [Dethiosulfovibrio faecalis]MCF4151081.1 efflux RND transporter periplasmic adaptor subunit [Dethiosulfovibrio faecalis]
MNKKILWVCAVLFLALGSWFLWSHVVMASEKSSDKALAKASGPRPVALETVGVGAIRSNRRYPGVVEADQEAFLAFRVAGPLTKVDVQLGDLVKKGQRLAQVDSRDFRDEIEVLKAQLEGARATLENAQTDYDRSKSLLKEKVIAQAEYDGAKKAVTTARSSVRNISAQLDIAGHRLQDTELKAPFDGIVSERKVENHEMVSAGQVVMGLLDISTLKVTANVPEGALVRGSLSEGTKAELSFPSIPDLKLIGTLEEWSSSPDPATRTYSVSFVFPAPEGVRVLPGMTAEVLWNGEEGSSEVVTVPLGAVVSRGDGGSSVWVYDPDEKVVRSRSVSLGKVGGDDRLPVIDGLRPGESIVVAGVDFITEGMSVSPLER